ncbi:MAG: bifunctional DNA primase/polymerase [Bryobacteraceae bacterium]|nr:bifunctional DNA primase/polymerase [Bryobacteraceae bacterium]
MATAQEQRGGRTMTAAGLLDMGLSVIPATARKAPAVAWKSYQTRIPSRDEFDGWARTNPPVWGIVTGAVSRRVVLDFDGDDGQRTLERLGLRPHVITPSGGAHLHVEHPGFSVSTQNHISASRKPWSVEWPGLDIRGDGGFEALIGATDRGEYSIVRDLSDLEPWNALPANFRRHFEPRVEQPIEDELLRRALDLAASSGRNEGGLWLACQLRDNGLNESEAEAVMGRYSGSVGPLNRKGEREPYTIAEARESLRSAYSRAAREPWRGKSSLGFLKIDGGYLEESSRCADPDDRLISFPYTDSGNAERFEMVNGGDFRYCGAHGKWYAWDGTRWAIDDAGRASLAAKDVARRLYAEAATITDDTPRRAAAGWARQSESAARRAAMLTLAQGEGRIPVRPEAFDADPWLLNVLNGVVDLRTGELLQHRREGLMTRQCPVVYDPGARSHEWAEFLRVTTDGDDELIEFLMRVAGYAFTGSTREEKLFMVLGPTGSGKSTWLEALKSVAGDYARTADFETFTLRRDAGIRNDIAALAGRRLVLAIETEEGKRLAEGLVKSLTGRDTIAARYLYGEFFEFRPQFKLILAANDAPKVRHQDEAIWRRIVRLPFEHTVPASRRDPGLKERLTADPANLSAILAWAIEGCLRWQESGLGEPERVRIATLAYREDQDPLREFIQECCELGPDYRISTRSLRGAYERFCEAEGYEHPLGPKRFADALKMTRCEAERTPEERLWRGIRLK